MFWNEAPLKLITGFMLLNCKRQWHYCYRKLIAISQYEKYKENIRLLSSCVIISQKIIIYLIFSIKIKDNWLRFIICFVLFNNNTA